MRRVTAKFVPRLMLDDQKQHRVAVFQELLEMDNSNENFIKTIITDYETWVYGYDVETKVQLSQWKLQFSPRPKIARQVRSKVKEVLTVFFDFKSVFYHEFIPQGKTINRFRYLETLRKLHEAVRKKKSEIWVSRE